jgi:hypothetical protein
MATMFAVDAYEAWPSDDTLTCERSGGLGTAGMP